MRRTYWIGKAAAGARQRRRREHEGLHAGVLVQQVLDLLLGRRRLLGALAPLLQLEADKAAAAAVDADDQEGVVDLGDRLAGAGEPGRELLRVVGGRILRRVDEAEVRALVLFRGELGRRLGEHERRGREQSRRR